MAWIIMHVRREGRRTTVSMEEVLSTLLSLHLCGKVDPGVVARWCQEEIAADPGAYFSNASQRLAGRAALAVAPKRLQEAYYDQLDQGHLAKKLAEKKRGRLRNG